MTDGFVRDDFQASPNRTREEMRTKSRRRVAEWLFKNYGKNASDSGNYFDFMVMLPFSNSDATTPETIEKALQRIDDLASADIENPLLGKAVDLLTAIAAEIGNHDLREHFTRVYDFWMSEDININYSEIKGIGLAEMFLGVMNNPKVPARISGAMLSAMTDVFNRDITSDQKAHLTVFDDAHDADYIDKLFRAYEANQNDKETETVEISATFSEMSERNHRILARKISHILTHENVESSLQIKLENEFEKWADNAGVFIFSPQVIETAFSIIMERLSNRKNSETGAVISFIDSIICDLSKEHRDELKQFDSMPATAITENEKLSHQISAIMNNPDLPEHLRNIIGDEINRGGRAELFTLESVSYNLELLREGETADPLGNIVSNHSQGFAVVPSVSDIPHSKPPQKKRTPTQEPNVKKKKTTSKPDAKKDK